MRLGLLYLQGKYGSSGSDQYGMSNSTIGPLGLGYLSAMLKRDLGFGEQDVVLEVDDPARLLRQGPDLIGITSFTETFEDVIRHARWLKRQAPEIPIIVGGEHISAAPDSLPPEVDIGVMGEGEYTLRELIGLYQRNAISPETLEKVPGIVFWHQGKRCQTPARAWAQDLDDIPMPDRRLIHRPDQVWQQPLFTSRGCPYQCTYCASTRFWQRTRYHSIPRVIAEIEEIVRDYPNQTLIAINDDLFPLNRKRLRAVVEAIRARGLHRKVGFTLNTRANVFDTEIVELLAAMNGQIIGFGFESASDKILDQLKGKTTARDALKALKLCEQYGIAVTGSYMIGSPDETIEDLARTWWFIRHNRNRIWRLSVLLSTPFPGTEFWHDAERMNLVDQNFQRWNSLDLRLKPGETVFLNQHFSAEAFVPLYQQFQQLPEPEKEQRSFSEIYVKRSYYQYLYQRIHEQTHTESALMLSAQNLGLWEYFQPEQLSFVPVQQGQVSLTPLQGKRFKRIVLLHALEKLRQPAQVLKQLLTDHLEPEGHVLTICYNVRHLSVLCHLLQGQWELTPFAVQEQDTQRFFSLPTLQQLLGSQGLHPRVTELFQFGQANFKPFQEKIIPLLQELGLPATAEQEGFSFWIESSQRPVLPAEIIYRPLNVAQHHLQEAIPSMPMA